MIRFIVHFHNVKRQQNKKSKNQIPRKFLFPKIIELLPIILCSREPHDTVSFFGKPCIIPLILSKRGIYSNRSFIVLVVLFQTRNKT